MKKNSSKIMRWTLIVIVILSTLLMMGGFIVKATKDDLDNQNRQFLTEIAVLNANAIDKVVNQELDKIKAISNIAGGIDVYEISRIMEVLGLEAQRTQFKRLGFIDLDGNVYATDGENFNANDREYFKLALQGISSVSNQMIDKTDGQVINVYATPYYWQGELKGVVIATNRPSVFSELINTSIFNGYGYSYIVDTKGTIIAHSGRDEDFQGELNLFTIVEESGNSQEVCDEVRYDIMNHKDGVIEYKTENDSVVATFVTSNINDWVVISVVPKSVVMDYANRLIMRNLVSVMVSIFLFGGLLLAIILMDYRNKKRLERLAYIDPLLNCNNINKFRILVKEKLSNYKAGLYMVRVDVDNFKMINDMYGYSEGDFVLLEMEKLISKILTNEDLYCHESGDNFMCLLMCDSDEEVIGMGTEFRNSFKEELNKAGKQYKVNFTTGVYKVPPHEKDVGMIMDRATMAHQTAKQQESERKFCFYTEKMRGNAISEKEVENVMYEALNNREFQVYLQPKMNINTGKMVGAEALVRWIRDGKVISPADFIPLFEKNGFIVNIDMFVLEEVCRMQRDWLTKGLKPLPISVNQSKALVYSEGYVERLEAIINKYDLPPHLVELELLETIIHESIEDFGRICSQLRSKGFLICVDDFGSGYSSFNLLKDIVADVLKVDREFLRDAETSNRAGFILSNIVSLARGLDMSVVVEGVETREQVELLEKLSCYIAQGFFYAKPMPKDNYEELLKEN
ncbi:bifunctional diguanylate cyclase/phosphodiesterase [Anaerorhabdus sp.]|uniref:bifunctional diguanylate cyclase/phosphodiesterase n=1 Tax=Anaerorhabdus sp. TaxID=1872524 RepID=UPI002FCAFD64